MGCLVACTCTCAYALFKLFTEDWESVDYVPVSYLLHVSLVLVGVTMTWMMERAEVSWELNCCVDIRHSERQPDR
jgi:hypothetical protein